MAVEYLGYNLHTCAHEEENACVVAGERSHIMCMLVENDQQCGFGERSHIMCELVGRGTEYLLAISSESDRSSNASVISCSDKGADDDDWLVD